MKASRIPIAFLFVGAVVLLLADAWWLWKPRPDQISGDTLIHLVFARNFLDGRPFEYNIGQPSRALTSLLWNWLLAAAGWLTGTAHNNAGFLTVFRVLSIGVLAATLVFVYRIARRLGAVAVFAACGVVILATNPSVFYWMIANPMETSGAALIAVLAVSWAAWTTRAPSPLRWALGGLLVFTGFLIRPEMVVIGSLAALAVFAVARPLPWKGAFIYGGVLGLGLLVYAAGFHLAGLSGLPNAGSARRLMLLLSDASHLFGIPYSVDPFVFVFLFVPLLIGALFLLFQGRAPQRAAALASLLMAAFAAAFFAFYFYTTWQGRYLLPVVFALVPPGVAGLSLAFQNARPWRVVAVGIFYSAALAALLLRPLSAYADAPAQRARPEPVFVQPQPSDRTLLCQEIQSAYFYPQLTHICTEGLIGLESLEARKRNRTVLEFIYEQRPDLIGMGRYPLRDPENVVNRIATAAQEKTDLQLPGVKLFYLGEMAGCGPVFRTQWDITPGPANP